MSILIKGMGMPTRCEECPCKTADAFGGLGCQATGYIPLRKVNQDRPDWCPLVPVPPHGRLIDADALHYSRIRIAHNDGTVGGYNAVVMSAEIKDAPTIIPAEEGE